jgi:divalent metal cation (Fe/Co/Zn/Cd) transporter
MNRNLTLPLSLKFIFYLQLSEDPSLKNTFGWHRMDVVGSISSLVFLFSLCFATFVEALQTLAHTGTVQYTRIPVRPNPETKYENFKLWLVIGENIILLRI